MPPMVKSLHIRPGSSGSGYMSFCAVRTRSRTVWLKRQPWPSMQRLYSREVGVPFCGAPKNCEQSLVSACSASLPRACFRVLL